MTALLKVRLFYGEKMKILQQDDFGYWLLTQGSNLYLVNNELPFGIAKDIDLEGLQAMQIGEWKNYPLWLVAEQESDEREYVSLSNLLSLPEDEFHILSRGVEINHFLKTHKFCGKCGHKTQQTQDELAVQCIHCGYQTYPVICPSIIVAVRRGHEILLANHKRHYSPNGGIYTTLAGFVEVGETFEQAVQREVFEETGISIKIFVISVASLGHFQTLKWSAFLLIMKAEK